MDLLVLAAPFTDFLPDDPDPHADQQHGPQDNANLARQDLEDLLPENYTKPGARGRDQGDQEIRGQGDADPPGPISDADPDVVQVAG